MKFFFHVNPMLLIFFKLSESSCMNSGEICNIFARGLTYCQPQVYLNKAS